MEHSESRDSQPHKETDMSTKLFNFALAPMLLAAGLTVGTSASALTLNTVGLKANATLTFSVPAYGSATAASITFKPVANMTLNGMVDVVDPESGEPSPVPQYNLPVTKADVAIGWDLSIKATSGDSVRSALLLQRRNTAIGLANFKVDFVNKVVLCDFILTDGTTTNGGVYTFNEIIPQKISFKGLVLNQSVTIGNLVLTTAAQKLLGDTLALSAPLRATLVTQDWGTIAILVTSYKRSPAVSNKPFVAADLTAAIATP
jgi:hypothetical protein